MSVRYERKDHVIITFTTDWEGHTTKKSKVHLGGRGGKKPSINAAKRESRQLQMVAQKALGRGVLKLVA